MGPSTVCPHRRLRIVLLAAVLAAGTPLAAPAQQQDPKPRRTPASARKPAAAKPLTPAEQRIRAVENGLVPTIRVKGKPLTGMTLAARMKKYHVRGVSIAVINDYRVEWVKGYGMADAATKAAVDTATAFQAGATGQPVAVFTALRLAQSRKLDLDKDVNKSLKTWKVPNSDFTKKQKVTARALLTHSAGLSVTSAPGYEPGSPVPTLAQVLYGTPPAVGKAVVSHESPGEVVRPSAGNFSVVQLLIEDATRRPFVQLATDSVLGPLGMSRSGFFQPPAPPAAQNLAAGHDANGTVLAGKWRVYPELAAAGLWSTPGDLAQIILEVQQADAGRSGRVLNTESARQLLISEHVGWPGLGFSLDGREASRRFRVNGSTAGFESELIGYVERGQGAVVMTNTAGSSALIEEIFNAIAKTYDWPGFVPAERVIAKVDPKVYDRFVGRYSMDGREISIARKANRLYIGPAGKETTELLPESVSEYFTPESGSLYSFVFDEKGKVQAVTQRQRDVHTRWDRK